MIHRFHLDEFYIVVDPCSASVHVVDEIAYELIVAGHETCLPQNVTTNINDGTGCIVCVDINTDHLVLQLIMNH